MHSGRMRSLIAVAAFAIAAVAGTAASGASAPRGVADCATETTRDSWVGCVLGQMSLEQKVGQMFVVNGFGETVDATDSASVSANTTLFGPDVTNIADLIETYQPGGIVYFNWSNTLSSPSQVAELSNGIQQVAGSQPGLPPLAISVDQEEGEVTRITQPATVFPGNMALGATRDLNLAYENAAITGRELGAMGINVDNAPVVDVNTNPENTADGIRAFGDRTKFVSRFGATAVEGYQKGAGISAVAKHWPGLGDTDTNPDTGITVSDQTLAQLRKQSFPAFEAAIDAGVDSVMVTHIEMPNIEDNGIPTSLSPLFVDGLLRDELGFNGVVVTDALNAQALANFTPEEVALRAVEAGNDQLLEIDGFPSPDGESILVPAYNAVLNAVRNGEIPLERIEESVRRILAMKWKAGLAAGGMVDAAQVNDEVGTSAHLNVARKTAKRSITLLKNRRGTLPLDPDLESRVLSTGWGATSTPLIANEIASRDVTTQSLQTGSSPTDDEIARVRRAARQFDAVVVNTSNVWAEGNFGQVRLVRELAELDVPVVVIALNTPYDVAYLRKADAFIATYDFQQVSVNAAVAALFGSTDPQGRLPVTVPKANKPGKVYRDFGFGISYSGD